MIDKTSINRGVRLLFITGILGAIGFSAIGILIKEVAFMIGGLIFGLLFFGIGIFCNYLFKRNDIDVIILEKLKPIFWGFIIVQLIIFILNFGAN